jgi:hypothetical protein
MVLHQVTWPPKSPDINPIEMVWDVLDGQQNEGQQSEGQAANMCSAYVGTVWKAFQVKLVERISWQCGARITISPLT